jgi:hypothetical protein
MKSALLAALVLTSACVLTEETRTLKFDQAIVAIDAETDSGDLSFSPSLDGTITVTHTARFRSSPPVVEARIVEGVLQLRGICDPLELLCSVDFEVQAPPALSLVASSGSGDLSSVGLSGPLNLSTGSGDIRADGALTPTIANTNSGDFSLANATGGAVVFVGSGNISFSNVSGDLNASTNSGDIFGDRLRSASVRLSSGSGNIEADLLDAPDLADAESSSGDISLRVPAGAYQLDAETESGDVDISGLFHDGVTSRVLRAFTQSGDVSLLGR